MSDRAPRPFVTPGSKLRPEDEWTAHRVPSEPALVIGGDHDDDQPTDEAYIASGLHALARAIEGLTDRVDHAVNVWEQWAEIDAERGRR